MRNIQWKWRVHKISTEFQEIKGSWCSAIVVEVHDFKDLFGNCVCTVYFLANSYYFILVHVFSDLRSGSPNHTSLILWKIWCQHKPINSLSPSQFCCGTRKCVCVCVFVCVLVLWFSKPLVLNDTSWHYAVVIVLRIHLISEDKYFFKFLRIDFISVFVIHTTYLLGHPYYKMKFLI